MPRAAVAEDEAPVLGVLDVQQVLRVPAPEVRVVLKVLRLPSARILDPI